MPKTPASVTSGKYIAYSPKDRADIGKYCSQHGPASTVRNYKEMFPNVNESTVRGMKKKYNESLNLKNRKLDFEDDITELHPKKRGRPLLVGAKLDTKVQKCVTVLRDNGAVIKSQIVIAAAKGIIIGNDKILLAENDGSIDISKTWGKSHLKIMNYVKRRSSTACKNDKIENFDQLKDEF